MRAIIAVPVVLGLLGVVAPSGPGLTGTALEVVFFDVGQGDCAVLRSPGPDGRVIVIDGGFVGTANDSVVPYLQARGITRIDLMILTHPDQDHTNGLRTLIEQFDVEEIWDPGVDRSNTFYQSFKTAASGAAGDRYYRPLEDQIVDDPADDLDDDDERRIVLGRAESLGDIELILLHTDDDLDGPNDAYRINNGSIVVKVVYGENSILFTGDANGRLLGAEPEEVDPGGPFFTEAALLQLEQSNPGLLRSTVLKVPHHGSLTSSSEQFVEAVQPIWAVISSGTSSNHRLPRPATLARYGAIRANILRTDVGDGQLTKGDDHLVLILGERAGDLIWRQADTESLLAGFAPH